LVGFVGRGPEFWWKRREDRPPKSRPPLVFFGGPGVAPRKKKAMGDFRGVFVFFLPEGPKPLGNNSKFCGGKIGENNS